MQVDSSTLAISLWPPSSLPGVPEPPTVSELASGSATVLLEHQLLHIASPGGNAAGAAQKPVPAATAASAAGGHERTAAAADTITNGVPAAVGAAPGVALAERSPARSCSAAATSPVPVMCRAPIAHASLAAAAVCSNPTQQASSNQAALLQRQHIPHITLRPALQHVPGAVLQPLQQYMLQPIMQPIHSHLLGSGLSNGLEAAAMCKPADVLLNSTNANGALPYVMFPATTPVLLPHPSALNHIPLLQAAGAAGMAPWQPLAFAVANQYRGSRVIVQPNCGRSPAGPAGSVMAAVAAAEASAALGVQSRPGACTAAARTTAVFTPPPASPPPAPASVVGAATPAFSAPKVVNDQTATAAQAAAAALPEALIAASPAAAAAQAAAAAATKPAAAAQAADAAPQAAAVAVSPTAVEGLDEATCLAAAGVISDYPYLTPPSAAMQGLVTRTVAVEQPLADLHGRGEQGSAGLLEACSPNGGCKGWGGKGGVRRGGCVSVTRIAAGAAASCDSPATLRVLEREADQQGVAVDAGEGASMPAGGRAATNCREQVPVYDAAAAADTSRADTGKLELMGPGSGQGAGIRRSLAKRCPDQLESFSCREGCSMTLDAAGPCPRQEIGSSGYKRQRIGALLSATPGTADVAAAANKNHPGASAFEGLASGGTAVAAAAAVSGGTAAAVAAADADDRAILSHMGANHWGEACGIGSEFATGLDRRRRHLEAKRKKCRGSVPWADIEAAAANAAAAFKRVCRVHK